MSTKTKALLKTEEQKLVQLIVFKAGDEEFCVPIDDVQEVIKATNITPIPDAPSFMRGLINVRGDIVSIIDVKARFFLPSGHSALKHIIITEQPSGLFGLMVDEVLEVLRVKKTDINTTPNIILKIHDEYVSGIVVHDNRLIIMLDLAEVLSQEELIKLSDLARNHIHKTDEAEAQATAPINTTHQEENQKQRINKGVVS